MGRTGAAGPADGEGAAVKVMWFETSDGRYWVRLPAGPPWTEIMLRVVEMVCRDALQKDTKAK